MRVLAIGRNLIALPSTLADPRITVAAAHAGNDAVVADVQCCLQSIDDAAAVDVFRQPLARGRRRIGSCCAIQGNHEKRRSGVFGKHDVGSTGWDTRPCWMHLCGGVGRHTVKLKAGVSSWAVSFVGR